MLERREDGKLWHFTPFGGYPLYYIMGDGGILCPSCANGENGSEASETHEDAQWRLIGRDIHWEGEPLKCDHCYGAIPSAYGTPDDEPSDEQIEKLRDSAAQAGDLTTVAICDVALARHLDEIAQIDESVRHALERLGIIPEHVGADVKARAECARMISDAQGE